MKKEIVVPLETLVPEDLKVLLVSVVAPVLTALRVRSDPRASKESQATTRRTFTARRTARSRTTATATATRTQVTTTAAPPSSAETAPVSRLSAPATTALIAPAPSDGGGKDK